MGLLDDVLKSSLGGQTSGNAGRLLEGVLDAIGDDRSGGLDGLTKRSQQQGLGDVLASWIGSGPNRAISSSEVTDLLGRERVDDIAQRAGVSTAQAPGILAAVLPALIDKLTPDGSVPPRAELAERGRGIVTAQQAKPKADFSDVSSGSSSTAAPAKDEAPEIYVVAAGDTLSKIAKRFLGDANEWRRIYDRNRAVIGTNPDLIKPGQKLEIPKD
jgi:uncharacterized protein YidB (DUF937 family)